MSTKLKASLHNGAHTAGIFSDLSVDGPIIGTLVLVVDRAKNLPNRKTIGKQDPYCAARLGKEAKKTNTDIRGGQTPKWDQELRFGVHDSPDYYQLKISVFSDDKKTELIGENWVDLRDIIVSGGGQNDQWQPLQCRGKYAGEIRIEITYYDSRPKPKQAAPAATVPAPITMPPNTGSLRSRPSADLSGPNTMGPRAPNSNKRRPLPSDPVTGQAPVQAHPAEVLPEPGPAPVPAPPPAPAPAPVVTAPAPLPPAMSAPSPTVFQQQQAPQHIQTPQRQQHNSAMTYMPTQSPLSSSSYQSNGASPQPALHRQQPLAQVAPVVLHQDYHDPRASRSELDGGYDGAAPVAQQHQYSPNRNHYNHSGQHAQHTHAHDRSQYESRGFTPEVYSRQKQSYNHQNQQNHGQQYHFQHAHDHTFDSSPTHSIPPTVGFPEDTNYSQPLNGRPPPPPVHKKRDSTSGPSPGPPPPDAAFRSSLGTKDSKSAMRHDVLRSEAHRHSMSSAYPGRPTYQPIDLASAPSAPTPDQAYEPSHPRHLSHSSSFDGQYKSSSGNFVETSAALATSSFRKSENGPLVPIKAQEQHSTQPQHDYPVTKHHQYRQSDVGTYIRRSPSPIARDDYRQSPSPLAENPAPGLHNTYGSYDAVNRQSSYSDVNSARHREHSEAYGVSAVPTSLVPGVDPSLALELRSRIYSEDRSHEQQSPLQQRQQHRHTMPAASMMETSPSATPPRGDDAAVGVRASFDYNHNDRLPSQNTTPQRSRFSQSYDTPPQQLSQPPPTTYDHSQVSYTTGVPSSAVYNRSREASPQPQHTIRRKSVSPAPAPVTAQDSERRMSGVPFGPDSYDVLNLAVAEAKGAVRPNYNETNGKIIAFDGREVDPSDHLPVESWAPLPEPETPRRQSAATALPIDHTTPTSGRKQLRIAGLPHSSMGSSGVTFSSADDPVTTYSPTTRNRLQKRVNQQSAVDGPLNSVSPQGSPLAPLNYARQQQQQDNYTPPRALVRASTYDYPSENYAPTMHGSSPGRTSYGNAAPPVPSKIYSGANIYGEPSYVESHRGNNSYTGGGSGAAENNDERSLVRSRAVSSNGSPAKSLPWNDIGMETDQQKCTGDIALIEEMSRIDLGAGRGRRHNGRYYG
ncbi:hypothetical protein SEPCBS119000_002330 [Sporothrix epigloea]|uniref:C2 domain-containing protein n=1 Tax=Sporothrix epigloea TaxID=1892477 RepID=A0ABP0DFM0_9PEZI